MAIKTIGQKKAGLADFFGQLTKSDYQNPREKNTETGAKSSFFHQANDVNIADSIFSEIVESFNPYNMENYKSAISVMGYDLLPARIAIIVKLSGFQKNVLGPQAVAGITQNDLIKKWKKRVLDSIGTFFSRNSDSIVAYVGDERFLILKAVNDSKDNAVHELLKKSYKSIFLPLLTSQIDEINVGFGNAYLDIEGWCESCVEAATALKLGQKLGDNDQSYYFNDFGILYAIADGNQEKKFAMAKKLLERLRDEDLIVTLKSFLDENLNTTDTAIRLKIHRNTVLYRLDQIALRLGLDPRNFEDAFRIKMALYVEKICY